MNSRLEKFSYAVAFVAASACASSSPAMDGSADVAALSGAKVDISAEGGIAAFSIGHRIDHDTRAFAFAQRRICGTTCGAPSDSASGTLSPAMTDSLFSIVLEQARLVTGDDYGTTRNGADMMMYTIRVTSNGRVRTIRGDDGTLPDAARRIMSTVREAISAARSR